MLDERSAGKAMNADRADIGHTIDWADRAAVAGSLACMIHCVGFPIAAALLPALTPMLNAPEAFHAWMLAFTVPVAALALSKGWTAHGKVAPLYIGASGTALLTIGLTTSAKIVEGATTVLGAALLAVAHIINWRFRRACRG